MCRPPDGRHIHFPLIAFIAPRPAPLPPRTASAHSSLLPLAAVTLKETPNQNVCLPFQPGGPLNRSRGRRRGRIGSNQSLIAAVFYLDRPLMNRLLVPDLEERRLNLDVSRRSFCLLVAADAQKCGGNRQASRPFRLLVAPPTSATAACERKSVDCKLWTVSDLFFVFFFLSLIL